MKERRFPANVPEVTDAVAWTRARAEEAGFPEGRGFDLELAVEEVLVNVCQHAYGGQGGEATIRAGPTGEGFLVEIEDSGPPFDPLSVPAPDTSLPIESRPLGGLGVLLVRHFTDVVRWRRAGDRNVLTLVFTSRDSPVQAALSREDS